ncbi:MULTISPECIES: MFS transporter [Prauserella salsuginis group]|uniref:MFS transporter n=1 Tax=Prauserella salsuginis TaxID=387889 RepID=A0ABW6FY59_9PSEU|nr:MULTISPECIES: MFS transporter [Prauserella salsuginis group]MCR3720371.1 putative arabinose efflux permease, MFS family [Prauserella flava]MCR3733920.1 putative arabinose efflux permease, MFS family [Prauserella salsuginis]
MALTFTPFRRYWLSSFLADLGDGVRFAAFPLLALTVTDSPAAIAAVPAVQGLPWIVLGLGVGALVDRWDLRRTMVTVDVLRALVVAGLAGSVLTGTLTLPLIFAAAFVTGLGAMIHDTAAATAVPRLVEPAELQKANGRIVATRILGDELAGPALGGWLFGVATVLPLAFNASGFGISILLLLTLPSVFAPHSRPDRPTTVGGVIAATGREMREGLRWLRGDRDVRNLTVAVALVAVADGAYLAILVLYVTRVLELPEATYGFLLGAGAIGGVIAGALCARLTVWAGTQRMLTGSIVVMAGCQLLLGLTSNIACTIVALTCSSAAFASFNITAMTMRQRRSPAGMLGRVNSAYLTVARSADATGALAGGALAAAISIQAPILIGVLPMLVAATLLGRPKDPAWSPATA